eukprot:scaffold6472_cov75-Cylindrotheca_fusiformis.AAC.4
MCTTWDCHRMRLWYLHDDLRIVTTISLSAAKVSIVDGYIGSGYSSLLGTCLRSMAFKTLFRIQMFPRREFLLSVPCRGTLGLGLDLYKIREARKTGSSEWNPRGACGTNGYGRIGAIIHYPGKMIFRLIQTTDGEEEEANNDKVKKRKATSKCILILSPHRRRYEVLHRRTKTIILTLVMLVFVELLGQPCLSQNALHVHQCFAIRINWFESIGRIIAQIVPNQLGVFTMRKEFNMSCWNHGTFECWQ